MSSSTLFYIIISIICIDFIIDKIIDKLNANHFNKPIPKALDGIFNSEEYEKSQNYKSVNYKLGIWSSTLSFLLILTALIFNFFNYADVYARQFSENPTIIALVFFGIILIANGIFSLPFSIYNTFGIEQKFGFNTTTVKTYILDKIKSIILSGIIGGLIIWLLIALYYKTTHYFWLYAWSLISVFTIFMNMFYSSIIVPLFNKQTPLEEGELRDAISNYAKQVNFKLNNIYVIDGSKRSTKANAYFAGFGAQKRIVLYDTLIKDLSSEEIVAVLAHEVGHYKKRHIISNLIMSIITTGFTFYLLSIFISNPILCNAIGIEKHSFHGGLIAFGLLFSPISELTGLVMNYLSRKFEYQADDFAKKTFNGDHLINALKKLSKNNLSNLTPHKAYVFMHYSHPPLIKRIQNLNKK